MENILEQWKEYNSEAVNIWFRNFLSKFGEKIQSEKSLLQFTYSSKYDNFNVYISENNHTVTFTINDNSIESFVMREDNIKYIKEFINLHVPYLKFKEVEINDDIMGREFDVIFEVVL